MSSVAAQGHGRQAKQAPGGRARIQQACEQRRTKRYAGAATCQYWDVTDTDRPVLGHSKEYPHHHIVGADMVDFQTGVMCHHIGGGTDVRCVNKHACVITWQC